MNEVLDAGSKIPVLWLLQRELGSWGLSLLTESQLFRAARGGGFRKCLGRTGSDPVDTCPGRTAAGLGFDSWGGRLRMFPALHFPGLRLEAPAAFLPSPSAELLLFKAECCSVSFWPSPHPLETQGEARCSQKSP